MGASAVGVVYNIHLKRREPITQITNSGKPILVQFNISSHQTKSHNCLHVAWTGL